MVFNGRWVPMNVMDTIFLFWVIAVVVICAVLVWLNRSKGTAKDQKKETLNAVGIKRIKRKRRK